MCRGKQGSNSSKVPLRGLKAWKARKPGSVYNRPKHSCIKRARLYHLENGLDVIIITRATQTQRSNFFALVLEPMFALQVKMEHNTIKSEVKAKIWNYLNEI